MTDPLQATVSPPAKPAWAAIYALGFGVFGLITAEFLPMSLLTPMAQDLGISKGLAGQGVTATAVVALFTGLLIATLTRNIDRRYVLLSFSVLLIVSSLLVAMAVNFPMLLIGRLLLGISIGGFWTLSAATAMRLAPASDVPKALSVIFAGVSLATVVAAPLGSFLGGTIGWRSVFYLSAAFGLLGLVAQWLTLPTMTATPSAVSASIFNVLRRSGVWQGIACVTVVFTGHFALFTFIRPFLENALHADVSSVTLFLLGFGVANFIGTLLASPMIKRSLGFTLAAMPLIAGAAGIALSELHAVSVLSFALIAIWGLAFGGVPVAWTTWNTRVAPDDAESAGGLIVAAIQFAIALGAASGGLLFDTAGANGVFLFGGSILVLAGMLIVVAVVMPRTRRVGVTL